MLLHVLLAMHAELAMNWIRAHYDRFAVLVAALFLLLCAIFIWRAAAGFNENFGTLGTGPRKAAAPTDKALELQAARQKLAQPPKWTATGRSGLFVPEKHFIGPAGLPVTLQNTQVHAPVPNEWLEQNNLPIAETDVLEQDPDGDGYTNLEEWQNHTNPNDKVSHPPFIAKLKLKAVNREPFPLVFSASPAAGTFQLNYIDPKNPPGSDGTARVDPAKDALLARMGEPILRYDQAQRKMVETGFRVVDFTENFQDIPVGGTVEGGKKDVSELTIENTETKQRTTLIKEKTVISPESVGTFVYLWGERRELTIKTGEEFSLPPQTEIRYKLIDVQPDKAIIVNLQKPEERIEVAPLNP